MDKKEILAKVDHTLLKADATWPDIQKICEDLQGPSVQAVQIGRKN